ncbi:MAG: mucoidy inhibitor MuiA family protein, partial [Bacteroidota bacterium]
MKYFYLSALMILSMFTSQGQIEKTLKTSIKEVTVFTQGAQITRDGSTSIPKGECIIKVDALSPYVNPKSINVKGEGEFTILSVSHRLNYLNETVKNEKVDSLSKLIERLDIERGRVNNKQEVLAEKKSLLDANRQLAGDNGLSISELKIAVEFYENQIQSIKNSNFENELRLKEIEEETRKLREQIGAISSHKALPTSEIFVKVRSEKSVTGNFKITYPVENAGWFPKYDIRVKDVNSKLKLEYKADVFQSTGVDWDHVKLSLSTADPNKSGVLPNLDTWYLNFARNTIFRDRDYSNPYALFHDESEYRTVRGRITDDSGEGLPGVNVLVKGSTRGTSTDLDGNYELTVSGSDYLVYSYVGFETQEVEVGGRSVVDISLGGAMELQEAFVTGY